MTRLASRAVEVQELACKALMANVRFRLSPLLADNRGALIQRLGDLLDTNEFGWTESGVQVFTTDKKEFFSVSGRDVVASCEHFEDREETAAKIRAFVAAALDALAVEHYDFLGVRTFWIAPTDSFDGLRDALVAKFAGGRAALNDLVGKAMTDVGWVFEFHDADPRVTVRLGPMKSAQAMAQAFRVDDAAVYPPEFLFLDVDRILSDAPQPASDALRKLDRGIEHNVELAGRLGRYFTTLDEA
jgi:hypothetical protein